MQEWQPTGPAVLAALAVLAVLTVGLAVVLVRVRRTTGAVVHEALARCADLQARVDEVERRLAGADRPARATDRVGGPAHEFLITDLDDRPDRPDRDEPPAAHVPAADRPGAALFADLVLRESVVATASLAHGVRRAVRPESRDRIRAAVRREVRRARKARRAEARAARRLLRDGVALDPVDDAGNAA